MSEPHDPEPSEDADALGPLSAPDPAPQAAADEGLAMARVEPATPARERGGPNLLLIGGLAAATLVGVGIGVAAPHLFGSKPARTVAVDAPSATGVEVQVDTVHTAPIPDGETTVMPTVPPGAPDVPPQLAQPPQRPADPPAVEPPPERDFIADLADERANDLEPADMACAYSAANPASGCTDRELIRADRALSEAYRAAGRAGVPQRVLRDDARDWRDVSEDAANRSRAALLDAYRARTEDVWAMADEAAGGRFGRR